jgi:transcriptional antiterminator Rof (Rho-off)
MRTSTARNLETACMHIQTVAMHLKVKPDQAVKAKTKTNQCNKK